MIELNWTFFPVPYVHVYQIYYYLLKYISESTEKFLVSNNETDTKRKKITSNGTANIHLRQTNQSSINTNRKRVIKMLFVIVFEYFICWSPLYILNTWKVVDYMTLRGRVSAVAWSLVLLLSYVSSCIHPITYCFMNKNFRKAFSSLFRCFATKSDQMSRSCTEVSNLNSTTEMTMKQNTSFSKS